MSCFCKGGIMLTIWGGKQKFCDGMSRRNFLQIGAFGAGLTLAEMLRLRAEATWPSQAVRPRTKCHLWLRELRG